MTDFKASVRINLKIPISKNDGTPITSTEFRILQDEFLKNFGGYTEISPPAKGGWNPSKGKQKPKKGAEMIDATTSYEIFVDKHYFINNTEKTLPSYLKTLCKRFEQKEISCYYHDIMSTV